MVRRAKAKFQPKIGKPSSQNNSQMPKKLQTLKRDEKANPTNEASDKDIVNSWIASTENLATPVEQPPKTLEKTPDNEQTTNSNDDESAAIEVNLQVVDGSKEDKNVNSIKPKKSNGKKVLKRKEINFEHHGQLVDKKRKTQVKVRKSKLVVKKLNALEKFKKLPKTDEEELNIDQNSISISDLIYYNPMRDGKALGMHKGKELAGNIPDISPDLPNNNLSTEINNDAEKENVDNDVIEESGVFNAPQIRINDDGSIVIDEESLVIPSQTKETPDVSQTNLVFEDDSSHHISSRSYSRRRLIKPLKWSNEATNKFYKCLSVVGTDFQLMQLMYKDCGEDHLRKKYKREIKCNPYRIDFALSQQHLNEFKEEMFKRDTDSGEESQSSTTTIFIEKDRPNEKESIPST